MTKYLAQRRPVRFYGNVCQGFRRPDFGVQVRSEKTDECSCSQGRVYTGR